MFSAAAMIGWQYGLWVPAAIATVVGVFLLFIMKVR
jgi:sugar phosphate permease